MSEIKDNRKRKGFSSYIKDEDDSDISIVPKRVLTKCMSHDYELLNSEGAIYEYISCMEGNDTTQLLDDFILNSRINNILTCRPSRRNTKSVEVSWYTTTCYLSGKIIILFFTMLRLFSVKIDDVSSRTKLTKLWLLVEKMMWEIMTTNSTKIMSDPPSLEMIGQENNSRLGDFIGSITDEPNRILISDGLEYITSVSRGHLVKSETIYYIYPLSTIDYIVTKVDCSFVNSMIPIIAGISSSGGIIHWFSFVVNPETHSIYVYSSWADGDYPIQSIMTKVKVDIGEFQTMIDTLNNGSDNEQDINFAISTIQKYFFSNPPEGSKDVIEYLNSVFLTEGVGIIRGKFQIIMFPYYYKHCINISNLLLQTSLNTPMIRSEMSAVVTTSKKISIDIGFLKLKLLLIFLYTKMGCSNSGFYQTEDTGVRGGKIKRKRSIKKRKTVKRKQRYTRRHKKRIL